MWVSGGVGSAKVSKREVESRLVQRRPDWLRRVIDGLNVHVGSGVKRILMRLLERAVSLELS